MECMSRKLVYQQPRKEAEQCEGEAVDGVNGESVDSIDVFESLQGATHTFNLHPQRLLSVSTKDFF